MNRIELKEKNNEMAKIVPTLMGSLSSGPVEDTISGEFLSSIISAGGLITGACSSATEAGRVKRLNKAFDELNKSMYSLQILSSMSAVNIAAYNKFCLCYGELVTMLVSAIEESSKD